MRQETNNEMDLLLRRLGRRPDASMSADHLDADELSLYAENVLPPAARARYTEHLAECVRCRDLVVQLSSSAGVIAAQEAAKFTEPSVLRKFLASLFSPMVLRFAVPALGLVVVTAIGLVVLRNQEKGTNAPIAQVKEQEGIQTSVPASEPQQSSSPGESYGTLDNAPANKRPVKSNTDTGAVPTPPPNMPPAVSVTAEAQPVTKKVEQQEAEAKEAPAPKPIATPEDLKKLEPEAQKQKAETRTAANEPPAEKAYEQNKAQDRRSEQAATARSRPVRGRSEAAGVAAAPGAATPMGLRDDAAGKDKNDADTRTVAGRRFRKQGNVWIDTAFNSSRNVINLRRGSEQYRGIVADEPEIKRIADELGGQIIVVWKGQTYRIF